MQIFNKEEITMFFYQEPPPECLNCMDVKDKFDSLAYWFQAIVDQIYGNEEFNANQLADFCAEMTTHLNVKIPNKTVAIAACQQPKLDHMLNGWKEYNQRYLNYVKAGVEA